MTEENTDLPYDGSMESIVNHLVSIDKKVVDFEKSLKREQRVREYAKVALNAIISSKQDTSPHEAANQAWEYAFAMEELSPFGEDK